MAMNTCKCPVAVEDGDGDNRWKSIVSCPIFNKEHLFIIIAFLA